MSKKKLKLLFDANPIVNGNKSGVGYYAYYIIEALARNYPNDIVLVGHYFNFLNTKKNIDLPRAKNIKYVQSKIIPGKILSITRVFGFQPPLELFFKQNGDAVFFPNFVSLPSILKIPRAITIHDMCFEEYPEYVSNKNQKFLHRFVPGSVKRSKLIIGISNFTEECIKKHYDISNKIYATTHVPQDIPIITDKNPLKKFGIKKKYLLFISNLEPRKNLINLAKAYNALPNKTRNGYSLVIAGGKGWKIDEDLEYINKLINDGVDIILTGYVSNEERASLYSNATLYIMPSHYEGFGMTILEAMSYGVPVVCSDIPIFKETAENAALYFNKDDYTDISNKIYSMLSDDKKYRNYKKLGLKQSKKYNWDNVSKSFYSSLLDLSRIN